MQKYEAAAKLFRILGEPMRLAILDMLSCGELCACDILERLTISQSTLSHHMRVLQQAGIVMARKDATWVYYTINPKIVPDLHNILDDIILPKKNCICEGVKLEDNK
nr:ArsR family transcriptional regulator, arsenate/arsenite/antimonite-responsive transcriptional [Candidatus Cloacimonadota bacterium]